MIAWNAVEDAIRSWVVAGAAFVVSDSRIYFADQDIPAGEREPRVSIRIGDANQVGQAAQKQTYDAARPAGQEIEFASKTMLELTVDLQAFAPVTTGSGPTARSILSAVLAALALPSVRYNLNEAGLGVIAEGGVQRIPQVRGATHEDRATMSVRFLLAQQATERTTFIENVEYSVSVDEG